MDGRLKTITDPFGRVLTLGYSSQNASPRLQTLTDPAGQVFRYQYSADATRLEAVIQPDQTPADPNDNPRQTYRLPK